MVARKPHAIRWNWAFAGICLALLAGFRAADGALVGAILLSLAVIGAVLMALSPAPPVHTGTPATGQPDIASYPHPEQVERTLRWYRVRRNGWLGLATAGWAAAIVGVVLFPPLALVAAAVAAYAVVRYRQVHACVRTLVAVLPKLREARGDGSAIQAHH